MPRNRYLYETLSSLHVGTRKPYGRFMECADHIPGSAIRGAVAEVILRHCPTRTPAEAGGKCPHEAGNCPARTEQGDCLFADIFLGECALRFGHAYPLPPYQGIVKWVTPVPLTLRRCSRHPGDPNEHAHKMRYLHRHLEAALQDPPHGYWDVLLSDYALQQMECGGDSPSADQAAIYHGGRCPRKGCDAKAEPVVGYACPAKPDQIEFLSVDLPPVEFRTHVALSRGRRSAEEGLLFCREGLRKGTEFAGHVSWTEGAEHLADAIERVLEASEEEGLVLGRGGAGGMGSVRVSSAPTLGASCVGLTQKLTDLDAKARKCLPQPKAGGTYFSVDAHSPILPQSASADPDGWPWTEVLSSVPGLEVLHYVQHPVTVSGWSNEPGNVGAREALAGVEAGSTCLCWAPGDVGGLAKLLEPLEANGVGQRRPMGFGEVEFSGALHLMVPTADTPH